MTPPLSLGSPQLPSLPCVSCVSSVTAEPSCAFKDCSVFWDGREGGKHGVKAPPCSAPPLVCALRQCFMLGKSLATGSDVRSCSALKDFVCGCEVCEVWPFKAAPLSNFPRCLCLTLHLLCVYTESRRKKLFAALSYQKSRWHTSPCVPPWNSDTKESVEMKRTGVLKMEKAAQRGKGGGVGEDIPTMPGDAGNLWP